MEDNISNERNSYSMETIRLTSESNTKITSFQYSNDMENCSRCGIKFKRDIKNKASSTYCRCENCKSFSTFINDIIYNCNIQ